MNRYMMGIAMALLLVASDSVAAQTRARVEYRNGRIDVGVALGRLPVRVSPHGPTARGWVAAGWGPVRIRVASRPSFRHQGTLDRKDLRYFLGKEMVKDMSGTPSAWAFGVRPGASGSEPTGTLPFWR